MSVYTKLACFAGGALFGSFGVKLLSSKDAKKAYVHVTAAGLRMKDSVMGTVTTVQENAADILASAKELNEDRAAKEAEEAAAANLERHGFRENHGAGRSPSMSEPAASSCTTMGLAKPC